MKKWQFAVGVLMLVLALAGAVGASLANTPPPPNRQIVVVPGTIVVANPDWRPAGTLDNPPADPLAPALPAAAAPVLFSADFSSPDTGAWQSSILHNTDQPAVWRVHDGLIEQAGDVNTDTSLEEAYLRTGGPWADFTLEADVLAHSGEGAGLIWRSQGNSFYRLQLYPALPNSAAKAVLELVRDGHVTVLGQAPAAAYGGYQPHVWQQVRVTAQGSRQQVWLNGQLVIDAHDATLTSGQVGLFAWADSNTRFDNVRVQSATR